MTLSIYTGVKDGLFYDFHVEAMLRHHLPLADEIVVNEGFSTDGTYEAISVIDPKIKVHRFEWDRSDPSSWHRKFKNQARRLCTGDWCILLDCDEFIPEWEFARLRAFLESTTLSIVPVRFVHFYANYRVFMARLPRIVPELGYRIHRNVPEIEVWGDGANVSEAGKPDDPSMEMAVVRVRGASLRQRARALEAQAEVADPGQAAQRTEAAVGQAPIVCVQHVSAQVGGSRPVEGSGALRRTAHPGGA